MSKKPAKSQIAAGYAMACANLARDHHEDQLAWFVLLDSNISLSEFERCGLDDYDLNVVRELFAKNEAHV